MKEILDSEVLSDEELEKISGGDYWQSVGDSEFLNKLGYTHNTFCFDVYSDDEILNDSAIEKAWASAGVTFKTGGFSDNEYYMGDKQISRKDAFRHVMKNRGWNQIAIDCFDFDRYSGDF